MKSIKINNTAAVSERKNRYLRHNLKDLLKSINFAVFSPVQGNKKRFLFLFCMKIYHKKIMFTVV